MKNYNLDGLPGLTIFGKPGENGQRGCMTFYSSSISTPKFDDYTKTSSAHSIAVCDDNIIFFYTNGIKPIINDVIVSNTNGTISKYIIYKIISANKLDKSLQDKIKTYIDNIENLDVYIILFENSNKISTNSINDIDFSLSISSSIEKSKSWPGFYTIDYLNKKSMYSFKTLYFNQNKSQESQFGYKSTDFIYYKDDGTIHIKPTEKSNPYDTHIDNSIIKQNFIDLYKDRFNCVTNENSESDNYKLVIKSKEYDESLFVYKQLKTDKPLIIKLRLLDAFNGEPLTNTKCSNIIINCDVTNLYDATFGEHGIKISSERSLSDENTYVRLSRDSSFSGYDYIKPFGHYIKQNDSSLPTEINDIASINTIKASNVISDDNGYVTINVDINKLNTKLFNPETFISFSYVRITYNSDTDYTDDKFMSGTILLNSLNEIKFKDNNIFGFNCYLVPGNLGSFTKTIYTKDSSTKEIVDDDAITAKYNRISEVTLTNMSNKMLNTFIYDYGDLPFFRTDKPSLIDYNDTSISINDNVDDSSINDSSPNNDSSLNDSSSKIYKPIIVKDDDGNIIKVDLPFFEIGSSAEYESSLNQKPKDSSIAVMSFTLSSSLSDSELDKYKIVAEFTNNNNVFKLSTSSCMNKLWKKKDNKDNISHPLGDADKISNKLNFNNEDIFPCNIIIKNFTDKLVDESLISKIKMPFDLIKNCKINVYAYYKETPTKIIKIYLGETRATETFE